MQRGKRIAVVAFVGLLFLLIVLVGYKLLIGPGASEAVELRTFVQSKPRVPIVFTSRTEPSSFEAAAPDADGFTYPGTIPWKATEGRLRLLDTDGKVYELTWGRSLPDGSTLIDVMSPSITLDGKRVLFAGRKAAPDHGRWRIYEIGLDGRGFRQITGIEDDPGCILAPPMRYAADGSLMSMEERKRIDYDDVDPVDQSASVVFASSRLPDYGRNHSRRATQLWILPIDRQFTPRALTANRNNDRWPYLTFDTELLIFSMWSRNLEAVTADEADVQPVSPGRNFATRPTDNWMGGRISVRGVQFGYSVKIPEPVWRPRPLFNGRIAFATPHPAGGGRLRIAQADWGYLRSAPSSLAVGSQLPAQADGTLAFANDRDTSGQELTMGSPSPYPDDAIVFSGAPVAAGPSAFAIYEMGEDWTIAQTPKLLFDDPNFVDAEPVAVYKRSMPHSNIRPETLDEAILRPKEYRLVSGKKYDGPLGQLHNYIINRQMPDDFPGQMTDAATKPVVPFPTAVKSLAFYAAYRDRFDDPDTPRIPGGWEKLATAPLDEGGVLTTWLPAGPTLTTVLTGVGADGKIVKWSGAKDSAGRSATYFAIAGDHYSGTRKDGYHFCLGCHTGHTFIKVDIRERRE